jgi:hypothetical protein
VRRARNKLLLLALAMVWLGFAPASVASDLGLVIIVHPDNPLRSVERSFLQAAYLKHETNWPNGVAIRPVDLARNDRARERFGKVILGKTQTQLRSYWSARIFSGTDVPPSEVDSPAAAIKLVVSRPGAVAYLPSGSDPGQAKVLELR